MTDFASIGIKLDSTPVTDGTKALDALADASVRVEQRVKATNGQMADTAKIMAAQAEQAKATAASNAALGSSTTQLTIGQQQLIERYREQAATIGMSRSQLMSYQAAQMGVTAETEKAITAVKAHEEALKAAAKAKDDAAKASDQLASMLKSLAAAYAALKVGEYIKDSAMLAARYETLGVVMEVVGRNAGYTKTQMDAASQGIARQGITMVESREAAVKLVQAHVDLQHAEGLARIAQNAAVIGHINSSEAFDRLVNGIARGNVLILRNIGINVNLQAAYREMADELGKTTKELTENERVEARRIAVFERGADINDVYTKSMDTAGKQILSMQRYTQDFKTTFGETFNEVLTIGVMALTDHLKDSNKAITDLSKNNQLEEWGHNLTSIFVTLANQVSNAYTTIQKFDTFARHKDAEKAINEDFDAKLMANSYNERHGGAIDPGIEARAKRIESLRQAALAQENVDYVTHQAELSGNFDRFAKAAAEREATRTAKHKAEADARLKVDQEYAAKAVALLTENANKSIEVQQKAQRDLYKSVYVGKPTYRDTEGRESTPKVDQAENTRMADHLKRIETEVAAEKAGSEYMMRIDDMRHKAGELGDAEFYERRKGYAAELVGFEIEGYNKQLAELRKHHSMTATEAERNAKAIHDTLDKLDAAKAKYAYDDLIRDEEERLRKRSIALASDDMVNKYLGSLEKEAKTIENSNIGHEQSKAAVEREEIARLNLAIAYQKQFMAEQLTNGATDSELAQSPAILKFLEDQRDLRERIAKGLDAADVDKANKKGAEEASRAWKHTATTVENDLTNAILDGGGKGWKKLVRDMEMGFAKMILQPILQPISAGIASYLNPLAAQAQAGGTGIGGAVNTVSNAYSLFSGGMTLSGGLGTGFMGSVAGGLQGAGIGSGLTSSAGLAVGESIAGIVGPQVAGALSSGMSMLAAAAPYLAAAMAVYAVWKTLDTSGTYHTGGAAKASAAGVTTVRAESLNFEATRVSTETEKLTAALASGIVNILDSTALAFGKTAGYSAATAFADDTSKDGAWGGLVIDKLGQKIVDWQDTKTGAWAPKVFADGAEGQAQYLAALSASVRTALNDIGLPDWAKSMLDGMSAGATIEELSTVVGKINTTQSALVMMGNSLTGFTQLSDKAVSALITSSGGIEALATNASAYYNTFYTEGEKSAGTIKQIKDALAAVNVEMPATQEAYRAELEAKQALGEAGAPAVAVMFKMAGAFAQVVPQLQATTNAAKSAADVLNERNDLQKQYDELTMTSAQLRDKERLSIDATNLTLFDQITRRQEVNATTDALKTMFDSLKSNRDGILAFRDSLQLGGLSTLTPAQKYLESQRQYAESLGKARANPSDAAAQSALQAAATTFLTASQVRNASSSAYVADRSKVLGDVTSLADLVGTQMSDAQKQLSLAGEQVTGLATLNTTALSIEQAIVDLGSSGNPGAVAATPFDMSRYTAAASAGNDALVAEIKALRAQVDDLLAETKGRRADAVRQSDDQVDATEATADQVAAGLQETVAKIGWAANNPTRRDPN